VLFPLARLLRLASVVICLITVSSFALFVINQTSAASAHQQSIVNGEAPPSGAGAAAGAGSVNGSSGARATHTSSVRRVIDDASNALTSPFSGITAGSGSEWTIRITRLLLALAVYGFGLGFLARVIRVRV
jgi:hypothetical protein